MFNMLAPPETSPKVKKKNTKLENMYINWQLKTPEMPDVRFNVARL